MLLQRRLDLGWRSGGVSARVGDVRSQSKTLSGEASEAPDEMTECTGLLQEAGAIAMLVVNTEGGSKASSAGSCSC